ASPELLTCDSEGASCQTQPESARRAWTRTKRGERPPRMVNNATRGDARGERGSPRRSRIPLRVALPESFLLGTARYEAEGKMTFETPSFEEIRMDAEIGSYQEDDGPTEGPPRFVDADEAPAAE